MSLDRVPALLASGLTLLGLAVLLGLQPYSVARPWSRFDEPGHRFIEAALRRDTMALEQLSASSEAVNWAIQAEQAGRNALAAWAQSGRASLGFTRGDTTDVWYDTPTDACPFRLTFVGRGTPRVVRAHARCYLWRGWPDDPSVISVSR
jgi:hypothetical protein